MTPLRYGAWRQIILSVLEHPPHHDLRIPKHITPRPEQCGFLQSIGEPQGQLMDFRYPLPDGRGIHAREYRDCYKVHWDIRDFGYDPLEHLIKDAPHWIPPIVLGILLLKNLVKNTERRNAY